MEKRNEMLSEIHHVLVVAALVTELTGSPLSLSSLCILLSIFPVIYVAIL